MNGGVSDFGSGAGDVCFAQIQQLFEAQAARCPDATAVECGGATLTYRQLNARANQLARYIGHFGVAAETPVALCLERSLDMVVAIIAVLKAGGTYVPIDLTYPKERAAFMLEDTRAPILLTQKTLQPSLPDLAVRVICIDSEWESIAMESVENPLNDATTESAAYIIFTSGSTGTPKGVLVTHRNIVRLFTSTQDWFGFNSSDVWTLFHSYAFDFSVWELWGALMHGGKLVVVPYLVSRSPSAFLELLRREKVTVLNQTPSAFRQLIAAEEHDTNSQPLQLRTVVFGGEALELQSLRPWFERHGDQQPRLINMYGITETTVHVTYRPITIADLEANRGSVIGVPLPDLSLHLLDENREPVPDGVPGEIFVGGEGVARGYLNRPELNRERFIADPFSLQAGARLYRSGDLGRRLPDGDIEYLGRIDHQIKIRGFRIELGEIESMLNQHPAVRESVVIAQAGSAGDKRLVAYVVLKDTSIRIPVAEFREFLGRKLPDYMIPPVFVSLASIPLTPNGKVDRKALPAPDPTRPTLKTEYATPRNEAEETMAKIWSEVLQIQPVGVHDNFFELGGDSIRAIGLLSRLQQAGFAFTLEQLFRNPSIAGLSGCERTAHARTHVVTAPFSLISDADRLKLPEGLEDAYPMIKLQTGMFYYNEVNPASAVYHDVFSFCIQFEFDHDKLEEAVRRVVNRHPILRTSFHLGEFSEPMQLVHREVQTPFTVENLRHLSPEAQHAELVRHVELEKRVPFDRTEAPLIRFHTQILGERVFQFIISFHHVCLDGWSLAALLAEALEDYAALLRGTVSLLAPPRVTYRDFVALERESIASDQCRRFWTEQIRDAGVHMMPRWPAGMRSGGLEQVRGPEIELDAAMLDRLRDVAASAGVPLKTVLLAAHQRVMAFLCGQSDVVSGLICNGRPEDLDGDRVIGLFLNTLPLRVKVDGGTWEDLVKRTFAAEQAIIPHRRFPLAEIQDINGGQPLFEAAFDFVHFHVYKDLQGCQEMKFLEGHYFEANNLATLTTFMLDATSTRLQFHIDYDPNLLCLPQVEQMSGYYLEALKALCAHPTEYCRAAALLSAGEREKILHGWNATAFDYPHEMCVHQLFEAQAERTPEAVAVQFESRQVTYSQLRQRVTEIAAALSNCGAGPEVLAGICLKRSIDMVAAMLAVLKAGGAYVPLDPAYPADRLAQIVSDAGMSVIVSTSDVAGRLPATTSMMINLDQPLATAPSMSLAASSDNLAYVIYTSGSTGKPKGVQVAHRSLVNLLLSIAETTGFSAADRLLAVTTFAFDIAGLELFLPLIRGGQLIIANQQIASDGLQLAGLVQAVKPSVMQGTPATWRMLIESGWNGDQGMKIFCGGEALSRALADALLARAGEVWNLYGPTETTVWSSAWKVVPGGPCLIGRPLGNTQIHILDADLSPTPPEVPGEIYIGGDGVARGYLNQPQLTRERFVLSPFDSNHCARLYRTGDLGRYLPDGQIECLGRVDYQVKIRGFRIEPGEVEAALRRHPAIKEALVMAHEDASGDKRLVAYLVALEGEAPTAAQLRDYLQTILPDYMVPSAFSLLPQFPLTPAGKIDRRSLPTPESATQTSVRHYVAPSSSLEAGVAAIWEEVFHVKPIGVEDSFFDLGGHSLTAIRVIARVRDQFGVEVPLSALFSAPTVKGLVQSMIRQLGAGDGEFDSLFDEIGNLSDEQAKQLLAAEQSGST